MEKLECVIAPFASLAHDLPNVERRWIIPRDRWDPLWRRLCERFSARAEKAKKAA